MWYADYKANLRQGAALASQTQQAVREGRLSSVEGAAHLVSFLQQKEREQDLQLQGGPARQMHSSELPTSQWNATASLPAAASSDNPHQVPVGT